MRRDPEELLQALDTRTKDHLFCLHFARLPGKLHCLDFQMDAPDLDAMIHDATRTFVRLERHVPIPPGPKERWAAILDPARFTFECQVVLPAEASNGHPLIAIVVRGEF